MKKEIGDIIVPDVSEIIRIMKGKTTTDRIIEVSEEARNAGAPKRTKGENEHIEKK